jgi:threonine dehydrogenase-like Zn-dependent dehydrogenase
MVLKVQRCGICGSDVHMTSGRGVTLPSGCVLGHEYAGEVVGVGKEVKTFRVGDKVTAMPFAGCGECETCRTGQQLLCERGVRAYIGGFADYVRVSAASSLKLPAGLSMEDSALIEPLAVGLHGVRLVPGVSGKTVLVLGAGPIGLAVISALRAEGACRIAAAARSERRRELALVMGADAYVLTGEGDRARVVDVLGAMPDVVFECIGMPGALDLAIRHVRSNGVVVSLGQCMEPDSISVTRATSKQVRLIFSAGYTLSEFTSIADQLNSGRVRANAMISETVPLDAVGGAIEGLQSGARSATKIQVDPCLT